MKSTLLGLACVGVLSSACWGAVIWQQDFSSSSNLADYVGTGANKIKSVGTYGTGTASIDNGALYITMPAQATAATAGFLISPVGSGGTLKFSADITFTKDTSSVWGPWGNINFGKYDDPAYTYTTYAHASRLFATADFRRNGGNTGIAGTNFAWGAVRKVEVFMNDSASATTYQVGTSTYSLSANSLSVWVDGAIVRNNVAGNDYAHVGGPVANPVLNSVLFQGNSHTTQTNQIRIDNIVISDSFVIPEPSTLALAGIGGLALLQRRRQSR